jgi:hypothetical protein
MMFRVSAGGRLWLVGDGEALGNWDASKASQLRLNALLLYVCCILQANGCGWWVMARRWATGMRPGQPR